MCFLLFFKKIHTVKIRTESIQTDNRSLNMTMSMVIFNFIATYKNEITRLCVVSSWASYNKKVTSGNHWRDNFHNKSFN